MHYIVIFIINVQYIYDNNKNRNQRNDMMFEYWTNRPRNRNIKIVKCNEQQRDDII